MPTATQNNIDSLLSEHRVFECSDEFRSQAVSYTHLDVYKRQVENHILFS